METAATNQESQIKNQESAKLPSLTLTQLNTHAWRIQRRRGDGTLIKEHTWHHPHSKPASTAQDVTAYLQRTHAYDPEKGTMSGQPIELFVHPQK